MSNESTDYKKVLTILHISLHRHGILIEISLHFLHIAKKLALLKKCDGKCNLNKFCLVNSKNNLPSLLIETLECVKNLI